MFKLYKIIIFILFYFLFTDLNKNLFLYIKINILNNQRNIYYLDNFYENNKLSINKQYLKINFINFDESSSYDDNEEDDISNKFYIIITCIIIGTILIISLLIYLCIIRKEDKEDEYEKINKIINLD